MFSRENSFAYINLALKLAVDYTGASIVWETSGLSIINLIFRVR